MNDYESYYAWQASQEPPADTEAERDWDRWIESWEDTE